MGDVVRRDCRRPWWSGIGKLADKLARPEQFLAAIYPGVSSDTDKEDRLRSAIVSRVAEQAESLDYTVSYEESVLDGQRRVDLVLRRGSCTVACEICVANTAEYEVHDVRKCHEAGFRQVVVLCQSKTKLDHLREAVAASVAPDEAACVVFQHPDEFVSQLFDWAAEDPEGATVERGKPRKRPITLDAGRLSEDERRRKEHEMLQKLAEAMKRPPLA